MIDIKNLKVRFDGNNIINGIDLHIDRGENFVLLGKNGSGKSVVLKCVAGLIDHYSGKISVDGNDNFRSGSADSNEDNVQICRLAYVFQKGGLFDSMNVFDNVAFGLRRTGMDVSVMEKRVTHSISRVGLSGSELKLPSELSGGMQKRAGLARAICLNPEIILYDDPTAGLDPVLSDSIAELMLDIRRSLDTTSIIVTHDLMVAEKVADRIGLLYKGRLVFLGTGEEFFSESNSYAAQFIQGETEGPIDIF